MAAANPPAGSMPGALAPALPRTGWLGLEYKWLVLIAMLPGFTVFLLDVTIVNVALARLGSVFDVNYATVQWVITGYSLASGMATPMASYMEQRFTMKRVWVTALAVFTASSALCGLAPAFWVLVVGRIIQGFAGGMMLPMAISTLFQVFPPNQRGQAMGFFAIPMVAGPALGPTIGGYIVTNWDWRLVFFVNLPIGIAAVTLGWLALHPGRPRFGMKFDTLGAVLSSLGFGLTLFGLSRVDNDGWGAFTVRGLISMGLISLVLFIFHELRQREPLLDMRLFARWQFLIANVVGWVSTIALFGAEFLLPLYLQNLRGLSAVDTGLMLMPQGLSVAIAGPIAGRMVDRIGARWVSMFGFALLALNTWQMSQITLTTSFDTLKWLLVIRGLALGCTMQPTQLSAMAVVPPQLRTNASSVNNAMRNVFQSFGVALLSTVVTTATVVHTVQLSWQVRADTMQGQALPQLSAMLQQTDGLSGAVANVAAMATMLQLIGQQAAVLAFGDAYRITFYAAVIAFFLASMLPGKIKTDPSAMAGGH
ncbi:MAG: DHA2 family efflux MFS transporter permease subunit [Chloroflexi bacterium]|nr:DHA2 family efflux MFS transporter permease subunit [Chloroflexota bacterium]MBV9599416.1 DHA2 family efflux MFS transporter permease subunit [Chloroflexota bacterium]